MFITMTSCQSCQSIFGNDNGDGGKNHFQTNDIDIKLFNGFYLF